MKKHLIITSFTTLMLFLAQFAKAGNTITYTSSDGQVIEPNNKTAFGATLISNEYKDGVGTMTFDGDVTTIGYVAFYYKSKLTSITIPSSVTQFGYKPFGDCTSLTTISLPPALENIGDYTFQGCKSLTTIDIPSTVVTIGNSAFSSCESLSGIEIPSSVTNIGDEAFNNCFFERSSFVNNSSLLDEKNWGATLVDMITDDGLIIDQNTVIGCQPFATDVEIPDNVTAIAEYAFASRHSLTSIKIPLSVISIGNYAFESCSKLSTIEIPDVENLGKNLFYYTNNVKKLIFTEGTKTAIALGLSSVEEVIIPSSVTKIGESAFYSYKITSIDIPENVSEIEYGAFNSCSELTSVGDLSAVTSIGERAFYACYQLASIGSLSSVKTIGRDAFYRCYQLTSVGSLESLEEMETNAFNICTSLSSLLIPSSKAHLANYAINNCNGIKTIEMHDAIQLEDKSFFLEYYYTDSVETLIYTEGSTIARNFHFRHLKEVTIPSTVTTIEDEAFYNCTVLPSIELPAGLTTIGARAFYNCRSLTSIDIPSSVTSIGEYAFASCTSLTAIDIPSSVTSIAARLFSGCSGLTSYEIPTTITSIGEYAFANCSSLSAISIPSSIDSIGSGIFQGCSALNSIELPSSIDRIASNMFNSCTSLTTIDLPSSVTSIEREAFSGCTALSSITLPNSVTSIGSYAFKGCTNLTTITLSENVKAIGAGAFRNCTALVEMIYNQSKLPSTSDNIFDNSGYTDGTLYVPADAISKYEGAFPWFSWGEIKSIDEKMPDTGGDEACATPTISFANGKLKIESTTEGAKCYYTIKPADIADDTLANGEISLQGAYIITAYAVAEGYQKSATATRTLSLLGDLNDDNQLDIIDVTILVNKILQTKEE